MSLHTRVFTGALLALALLAAPAAASPVLNVRGDGVRVVEDPYLPPPEATEVPAQAAQEPPPGEPPPPAPPGTQPPPPTGQVPPPLRRARTVRGAISNAFAAQLIDEGQRDDYNRIYGTARKARSRLRDVRRREVAAVIGTVEAIARRGELVPSRMPALFLILKRNTDFWNTRPMPGGGARITFGADPVIFQYYAGQGIQIQPLANFGRANTLYNACENRELVRGVSCNKGRLRATLEALRRLGADRSGFTAWEYYFKFGGGRPPWISSLAQGAAVQAFSRGSELLQEPQFLQTATAALGAFERRPPVGFAVPAQGGTHFLIYSFNPRLRVLNAFLEAVIGLHDYAKVSGDPRGQALYAAGEAAAQIEVPKHDTGAWSLYDQGGKEADLPYHRLNRDFLRGLCERTNTPLYCDTAERFTRYLEEDPRLEWVGATGTPRARRPARVQYKLSKLSTVTVTVRCGGRVVLQRSARTGYGTRTVGFTPPRAGSCSVRVFAKDLRNHEDVVTGSVRVR